MATGVYTQQLLIDAVDSATHGKSAQSIVRQDQLNRGVRAVLSDIDMRSMKRKSALSPNLFREVYDYTLPVNLKGRGIINIKRQVKRSQSEKFILVDEEEFDREKGLGRNIFTISFSDFVSSLRIDGGTVVKKSIHTGDSLTGNGTWALVSGTDATNLTIDSNNFIDGGGALRFDTNSGGTTAAIELTGAASVDLSSHLNVGSLFVWVYIPATSGLTNFILRWGSSASNYWSLTVTTNSEGNSFYVGWNLLRFTWASATQTGTVVNTAINYIRLTITKTAGMAAQTAWRVDSITSRIGDIYDIVYYTKFGWQTTAGVYLENSTATTDVLNVDTDEMEIIVSKCSEYISQGLKEWDDVKYFKAEYTTLKEAYVFAYPSEAIKLIHHYYQIYRRRRNRMN